MVDKKDTILYPEGSDQFNDSNPRPGKVKIGIDDITKTSKATLKDYLRNITEKSNYFPISHRMVVDPKTKKKQSLDEEVTIHPNSDDQIVEINHETNDAQFVDINSSSPEANAMRSYSDSGLFNDLEDPTSTLKDFFDKNKRGVGHNLLKDFKHSRDYPNHALTDPTGRDKKELYKVPEGAPEIQKRISSVLTNNRFSPSEESPYIRDGNYSKPETAFGSIQPELGVYSPNTPGGDLAVSDLRRIASHLMLKQTGHSGADEDPDDSNMFTVIPGSFIDTRVSVGSTYASNVYKGSNRRNRPRVDIGIADDAEESWGESQNPFDGDSSFVSINDGKSFGATNSPLETFTGNPLAATTFILQGLITLFGLSFVIGIFIDQLFKEFTDERAQGKDPSSLPMGQSTDAPSATLIAIGVPHLRYPVFSSIAYGLAAFFRMKWPKSKPDSEIGNFLSLGLWFAMEVINIFEFIDRINESKGFYVTIIRNIMRDNTKILDVFTDPLMVLGAIGEAALLGGSIKAVLVKLLSLFSGLSSFKFFMACAVVGEKCRDGEIRDFAGLGPRLIETMQDNGATRVTKSRVQKTSNALVWRHRSAPANMILPVELLNAKGIVNNAPEAMIAVAAKVGDYEGTESHRRKIQFSSTGRIKSEDAKKFEDELESEYMPFYFHDLRTNEMISFHAFITDMKDSFSVSYADSDGYGRIDPVKIYQKTARSISIGFWMIATSEEDFDSMWLSINKLTNMVYPQWSPGRQLASGGKSFIMPFSQIPTSSPMIRLRVGDFIRGNGSKFNLMKLFGLQHASGDEPKFNMVPMGKSFDEASANEELDKIKNTFVGGIDVLSEQETFSAGKFAILRRSTTHAYFSIKGGGGGFFGPPKVPFNTWTRSDAVVKIVKAEARPGGPKVDDSLGEEFVIKKPYQYRVEFVDPSDPANPNSGKDTFEMIVLASDLKVISTEAKLEPNTVNSLDDFADAKAFFGTEENAIMKAYNSTAGRGLAGFITSLDFDYADATYATGQITRRAPKMVKVSISFAPIHDIAPGMDSLGGMRAPLYPVGDISAHLAGDELAQVSEYGIQPSKIQKDFDEIQGTLGKRTDKE